MQHTKHKLSKNDELSLIDIIQFFQLNSKFIGVTTVILSAIAICFSLLTPKAYQKQLTLSVKPISVPAIQSLPTINNVDQAGTLAVAFLQNLKLEPIIANPAYNPALQKIDIILQSTDATALNTVSSKIIKKLQTEFQAPLRESLELNLTAVQLNLDRNKQILAQLEQQITQLSPNIPKQEALEIERAKLVSYIATSEYDKNYLQQTQKNLAEFTTKAILIKIITESEVQQTRSPRQLVVLAIASSLMLAVLAAIIRNQFPRWQAELSKTNAIKEND